MTKTVGRGGKDSLIVKCISLFLQNKAGRWHCSITETYQQKGRKGSF